MSSGKRRAAQAKAPSAEDKKQELREFHRDFGRMSTVLQRAANQGRLGDTTDDIFDGLAPYHAGRILNATGIWRGESELPDFSSWEPADARRLAEVMRQEAEEARKDSQGYHGGSLQTEKALDDLTRWVSSREPNQSGELERQAAQIRGAHICHSYRTASLVIPKAIRYVRDELGSLLGNKSKAADWEQAMSELIEAQEQLIHAADTFDASFVETMKRKTEEMEDKLSVDDVVTRVSLIKQGKVGYATVPLGLANRFLSDEMEAHHLTPLPWSSAIDRKGKEVSSPVLSSADHERSSERTLTRTAEDDWLDGTTVLGTTRREMFLPAQRATARNTLAAMCSGVTYEPSLNGDPSSVNDALNALTSLGADSKKREQVFYSEWRSLDPSRSGLTDEKSRIKLKEGISEGLKSANPYLKAQAKTLRQDQGRVEHGVKEYSQMLNQSFQTVTGKLRSAAAELKEQRAQTDPGDSERLALIDGLASQTAYILNKKQHDHYGLYQGSAQGSGSAATDVSKTDPSARTAGTSSLGTGEILSKTTLKKESKSHFAAVDKSKSQLSSSGAGWVPDPSSGTLAEYDRYISERARKSKAGTGMSGLAATASAWEEEFDLGWLPDRTVGHEVEETAPRSEPADTTTGDMSASSRQPTEPQPKPLWSSLLKGT